MNPIKAARIFAGYSSANKASKALGIDQSLYSKLENGKVRPSRSMLVKLHDGFGVTTDQLLGLEPLPGATPASA